MNRTVFALLLTLGIGPGCRTDPVPAPSPAPEAATPMPSPEAAREALLEADRRFAADAGERGLEGWMSHFAPDAVRLLPMGTAGIRGLDRIRERDAALFRDPAVQLSWAPIDAGIFADGKIGYTTGRFRLRRTSPAGQEQILSQGAYVSWWRQDKQGRWPVILDTGAPDSPPAPVKRP